MKLAFCIITQGDAELESLQTLIESTHQVFDAYFVTTNGTEVEKTKKWCETNEINYSHLDWHKDFSEQRNFNFSQVPKDFDYIVWADSDDVIVHPEELVKIAENAKKQKLEAVFFTYWYGSKFEGKPSLSTFKEVELTQMRERLLRPGSIYWKKRLHETPVPYDGEHYTYAKIDYSPEHPVVWLHLGGDRNVPQEVMDKRLERNRELLELDLQDERANGQADPRTLLYLMKIYAESEETKDLEECLNMGSEYLVKSGWDEERATCCRLMAMCYGKLGQDAKARDLLHDAIKEYPHDPMLYLYLARTYYNLRNFSAMKHWMELGLSMDHSSSTVIFANLLDMKVVGAELLMNYFMESKDKNVTKAWEAAKILAELHPHPQHEWNEKHLFDLKELDQATASLHKLFRYLEEIQREDLIPSLCQSLPAEMAKLPFTNSYYNRYRTPKIWKEDEICYYANFGGDHFEKWSPLSLQKGIGGSETAVIELAKRWAKDGWKVTVYGDPKEMEGEYDGVKYLPWYKFNPKDKFNIFIGWRDLGVLPNISAKKKYLDMHDVFWQNRYLDQVQHLDKMFVKSQYHRNLAPKLPREKMKVISNGI